MPEERFEERTESATPRRREEARERGHVARSPDLSSAVILLAAVIALNFLGKDLIGALMSITKSIFADMSTVDLNRDNIYVYLLTYSYVVFKSFLPFLIVILVFAVGINILQVGFIFTPVPMTLDVERLNPIEGIKRMFSLRGVIRLSAGLFKIAAIGCVVVWTVWSERFNLFGLVDMVFQDIANYLASVSILLAMRVALVLLVLAILEYGYQRWQYEADLKMSKPELKEELKRFEGDPKIRERRRSIQRQLAMQRMMKQVPKATVVITNPTEIAVALRYEVGEMDAPVVVAKGKGYIAEKIRNLAAENDIPIIERPPLARALYKMVEVGQIIPSDLYAAVAEVLAYVYKIKGMATGIPA